MVEHNLESIFNCRWVATEFSTGNVHSGRIDTLALSEDHNPVIIEYKKTPSSDLINQSLYYLHWITDHKGDFEVAVKKVLGSSIEVDWSDIRVICIAPEYKKYDLHAVRVMGANIELWRYRLYENNMLNIEEVYRSASETASPTGNEPALADKSKNPVMIEAGKKAAETRKNAVYNIEDHLNNKSEHIAALFEEVRYYITCLDTSIEEIPKKHYIAFKTTKNFVCLEVHQNKLLLFLKLNPENWQDFSQQTRDVRNIGHYGTGDLELTLKTLEDFRATKHLIDEAFKNIGG